MELTNMSAQDFAAHFAENNPGTGAQTPPPTTPPTQAAPVATPPVDPSLAGLSSEELAAKAGEPKEEELDQEGNAVVKPTKVGRPAEERLSEDFRNGIDKLFKSEKFSPFDDGKGGYIVPETYKDWEEVIDKNRESWIEETKNTSKEELLSEIIGAKSPAWQFLIEQSDRFRTPEEMLPLITAVNNQENFAQLDIENTEHQEYIVRSMLAIQNLPKQAIEDEIIDLKDRNKLADRAKSLKPTLDLYSEQQTNQILEQKQIQEQNDQKFWGAYYNQIENELYKAKDIDGIKLKPQHRDLIASAIMPDQNIGGLPIYSMIDDLVAGGNVKVLTKIALMAMDEGVYNSYFKTADKSTVAAGLQKVLRQSSNFSSSDTPADTTQVKTIPRKQYGMFP